MVAEHYAALGHYGPVRAGTARVTHRIQDLEPIVDGSRRATSQLQFGARAKAGEAYVRELHRRVPAALRGAVGRGVVRIVFPSAWRAAWRHVATIQVTLAAGRLREHRDRLPEDLSDTMIERFAAAYEAAMEPALEEVGAAPSALVGGQDGFPSDGVFDQALAEIPRAWRASRPDLDLVVGHGVRWIWGFALRFSRQAIQLAGPPGFHLAGGWRKPDPWAAHMEMFRMGLWPVFDDGVDTTVYVPAATDD
jgi:hypothetical protein